MLCQPEHRVGTILDGRGERVLWCKTIIDADDNGSDLVDDDSTPACIVVRGAQNETASVEVDNNRVSLSTLQLLVLLVFLGHVEIEAKFAFQGRDGSIDVSMEGRLGWSWSGETMQHHTDAHKDAPELRLDVEHPSWPAGLGLWWWVVD